jgi:fatty-acyl-CoA synthase
MACYLGDHARLHPLKAAVVCAATGATLNYRELDERSRRLARHLHGLGLRRGDRLAVLLENHIRFFEIAWAALRSGLLLTTVNRHLTADEAAFIVNDCDARVLISSAALQTLAVDTATRLLECPHRLLMDGDAQGWHSYEEALAHSSADALAEEWLGGAMLYSSGTTGRPKGVVRALPQRRIWEGLEPIRAAMIERFALTGDAIYLSVAPLYHAAALGYATNPHFVGGTTVFMQKFDAEAALQCIERHGITHSQWVPTMFIRMLKLPDAVRSRYDLSSHRVAIHAAAPCPVEVKRRMIDWWGPILTEYYSGTEANGLTVIDSAQALRKPGSVGRAVVGVLHICDEAGTELPAGENGHVYFEREVQPFRYHKDEAKTRAAQHPQHPHWTTLGDIGHVDEDGYLFLVDRKDFMIISGGVNIYPQAVENALALHPKVTDVAVFGVPDLEMGEVVKAVVELAPGEIPSEALADELLAFLRTRIARFMVPRLLEFTALMPRTPTGKLNKLALRPRKA